jgi:hypothetical protein
LRNDNGSFKENRLTRQASLQYPAAQLVYRRERFRLRRERNRAVWAQGNYKVVAECEMPELGMGATSSRVVGLSDVLIAGLRNLGLEKVDVVFVDLHI